MFRVIKHPRQQTAEIISQDASEMYCFSGLPAAVFKKSMVYFWLSLLISIPFSLLYPRIPSKCQAPAMVAAALLTFSATAAFIGTRFFACKEYLSSYPMERNRFIPTKRYLKSLKRELLFYSAVMIFSFVFMFWITKTALFDASAFHDLTGTFSEVFFFVFSPALLLVILIPAIDYFTGFIAILRYERANEGRLAADGPIAFPASVPGVPLPDSSLPVTIFLSQLKIDKCIGGYRIDDVDTYLAELQTKVCNGEEISPELIRKKSFRPESLFKKGYNIPTVDADLDILVERLAEENKP